MSMYSTAGGRICADAGAPPRMPPRTLAATSAANPVLMVMIPPQVKVCGSISIKHCAAHPWRPRGSGAELAPALRRLLVLVEQGGELLHHRAAELLGVDDRDRAAVVARDV